MSPLAIVALMTMTPAASAAVIYTYTSKAFEQVTGDFVAGDRIVFEFTVDTLLSQSLQQRSITPTSWRIQAGPVSFGSGSQPPGVLTQPIWVGATNAQGLFNTACFYGNNPLGGGFYVQTSPREGDFLVMTSCASQVDNFESVTSPGGGRGLSADTAGGNWTVRDVPVTGVPEPGSLALLGLALAGLGLRSRRNTV